MYNYYIRVTDNPGYEGRIRSVMHQTETMLGVFHTGKQGNNPHWHFAISCDVRNKEALRARLRKEWSVPKSISIREWDGERKALCYLFHEKEKGTFKVVAQKGYTDEEVEEYKKESYTKGPRNEDGSTKKKKEKSFSEKMVEDALEEFKPVRKAPNHWWYEGTERRINKEDVMRWVIRRYSKNMKVFDKFIVNRGYHLVAHHLFGKEFEDNVIDQLFAMNM